MAFCKYCGTQLEDGAACTCEKAVAAAAKAAAPAPAPVPAPVPVEPTPVESTPVVNTTTENATASQPAVDYNEVINNGKNIVVDVLNRIKAVWKAPVDEAVKCVNEANRNVAFIMIALQAVLSGVLVLLQLNKVDNLIQKTMSSLSSWYGGTTTTIELPYMEGFLCFVLASIIIAAIYVGVFYVVFRVVKVDVNAANILSLVSLRSIASIPFTVLACVVTLINQVWGLGVNLIAVVFSFAFLMNGMEAIKEVDKNKKGHIVSIVSLAALLISGIVLSVVSDAMFEDLMTKLSSYISYFM